MSSRLDSVWAASVEALDALAALLLLLLQVVELLIQARHLLLLLRDLTLERLLLLAGDAELVQQLFTGLFFFVMLALLQRERHLEVLDFFVLSSDLFLQARIVCFLGSDLLLQISDGGRQCRDVDNLIVIASAVALARLLLLEEHTAEHFQLRILLLQGVVLFHQFHRQVGDDLLDLLELHGIWCAAQCRLFGIRSGNQGGGVRFGVAAGRGVVVVGIVAFGRRLETTGIFQKTRLLLLDGAESIVKYIRTTQSPSNVVLYMKESLFAISSLTSDDLPR